MKRGTFVMREFVPDPAYTYLTECDIARHGDEYDLGNGRFAVIGTRDTFVVVGESIPAQILCYHPRRKK